MNRISFAAVALLALAAAPRVRAGDPEDAAATIKVADLRAHVEFLASDDLEGRATLQRGNDTAARYLAAQMKKIGLAPAGADGTFFQEVPLWVSSYKYTYFLELRLARGGERTEFEGFRHFTIAPWSGHTTVDGGIVFAGYGITAPEFGWDDYGGIEARGKVVVVMRHEPQEKDEKSVFEGKGMTKHSTYEAKVENARKRGAAALLIINDPLGGHEPLFESADVVPDQMVHRTSVTFEQGKDPEIAQTGMPVLFLTMETAVRILGKTVDQLTDIQRTMDRTMHPQSFVPDGQLHVRSQVAARLQTTDRKITRNVAGVIPGASPAKMNEVVVIGAHYDHLGTYGSGDDTIFNGADDDASGTAGMLEIAEAFASLKEKPDRTVLFIAFTGEELGLLGSRWYAMHPLFPLESTVAMLDLDMIGRDSQDNPENAKTATVSGITTSPVWRDLLESLRNTTDLTLRLEAADPGGSDFAPFRDAKVPTLFFFAGFHKDYHQVTDTADKIRYEKSESISRLAFRAAYELATKMKRPVFTDPKTARPDRTEQAAMVRHPSGLILRILSEEEARKEGLEADVRGLRVFASPRNDLQEGDVILEVADQPVPDVATFLHLLKESGGLTASLFVLRPGKGSFFVHLKGAEIDGWASNPGK